MKWSVLTLNDFELLSSTWNFLELALFVDSSHPLESGKWAFCYFVLVLSENRESAVMGWFPWIGPRSSIPHYIWIVWWMDFLSRLAMKNSVLREQFRVLREREVRRTHWVGKRASSRLRYSVKQRDLKFTLKRNLLLDLLNVWGEPLLAKTGVRLAMSLESGRERSVWLVFLTLRREWKWGPSQTWARERRGVAFFHLLCYKLLSYCIHTQNIASIKT